MKTTLHNHINIGDKPTIPNIVFKSAMWLIDNKMPEEALYLSDHYSLTEYQQRLINEAMERLNK